MSEIGKRLNFFERYLTIWVAVCMVVGVVPGKFLPGATNDLRRLEFGEGSRINLPIAFLIWLMIYPMMLKIDFTSLLGVRKRPGGLFQRRPDIRPDAVLQDPPQHCRARRPNRREQFLRVGRRCRHHVVRS